MIKKIYGQMKLMFSRTGFWLGFTCMMLLCLWNTGAYVYQNIHLDVSQVTRAPYAFILYTGSPAYGILSVSYMFLLLLPFSFAYRKDARTSMMMNVMARTGIREYYVVNVITCFCGTFLMMFIPLVLEAALNEMLFVSDHFLNYDYNQMAEISGDNIMIDAVSKAYPFRGVYLRHPGFYNILYALFFSAGCGIMACLIYAISCYVKSYSIILLLPLFVIGQITQKLQPLLEELCSRYLSIEILDYLSIGNNVGLSFWYAALFFLAMLLATALLLHHYARVDQLGK